MKKNKIISRSEKETEKIAESLLNKILKQVWDNKPIIFLLTGELGGGKTVFTRGIGKKLGIKENITSPTFVIMNEYKISQKLKVESHNKINKFLHFDLYRIKDKFELEEIKFIDQFSPPAGGKIITCIEWAENLGEEI